LLVEINQTEYLDRFLEYDSVYYYYLTAIDFTGNESNPTNIIDVQPLNISAPQPPSRVIVAGHNNLVQGAQEMRISWTPPDIGDLKNYFVYRGVDSSFTPNASSFIDSTNISIYIDRSAQINTDYYYKIVAVDRGFKESLPTKATKDRILSSPVLVSPANNTRFGDPQVFKWNAVDDAIRYEVFVANGPFSDVFWSSGKITGTEIAYNGPTLQSSKVYYWWVGAYSKDIILFEDGSQIQAQINSYSLINGFFSE
jgi:fibronectin type 3 domain-containing protein